MFHKLDPTRGIPFLGRLDHRGAKDIEDPAVGGIAQPRLAARIIGQLVALPCNCWRTSAATSFACANGATSELNCVVVQYFGISRWMNISGLTLWYHSAANAARNA